MRSEKQNALCTGRSGCGTAGTTEGVTVLADVGLADVVDADSVGSEATALALVAADVNLEANAAADVVGLDAAVAAGVDEGAVCVCVCVCVCVNTSHHNINPLINRNPKTSATTDGKRQQRKRR